MDFYITLGLRPGATTGDIKRAYRRLARRYHPNINPGDQVAATRFQQIVAAYETLIDPERRQRYDTGEAPAAPDAPAGGVTFAFEGFDFSVTAEGHHGLHVRRSVRRRDSRGGAGSGAGRGARRGSARRRAHHVRRRDARRVGASHGDAAGSLSPLRRRRTRAGRRGTALRRRARARARCGCRAGTCCSRSRAARVTAPGCMRDFACPACRGEGVGMHSESITVQVPPGISDGDRLRLAGHGNAGRHGAPSGDLFVTVRVAPHRFFRREGDHLHVEVPVALHEAALGARIDVPTPTRAVQVEDSAGHAVGTAVPRAGARRAVDARRPAGRSDRHDAPRAAAPDR